MLKCSICLHSTLVIHKIKIFLLASINSFKTSGFNTSNQKFNPRQTNQFTEFIESNQRIKEYLISTLEIKTIQLLVYKSQHTRKFKIPHTFNLYFLAFQMKDY